MSNIANNSCIHEVGTSLGVFTVHFPCAVFTEEHVFNHILQAIDGLDFSNQQQFEENKKTLKKTMEKVGLEGEPKENDVYSYWMQELLNKAAHFGTRFPQATISLNWSEREVYVMQLCNGNKLTAMS